MNAIKTIKALFAAFGLVLLLLSCDLLKTETEPKPKPQITLSQTEFDLSNDSTVIEIEVTANVEFNVTINHIWITFNNTENSSSTKLKDFSSTKLSFNIAKNEGYDKRDDCIIIKQKNGSLSKSIHVRQSQKEDIIILKNNVHISWESQVLSVALNTSVEYDIIIPGISGYWIGVTNLVGTRS